jgi:carbonic anhydrase/acetyltransferase-like protein (isoleucine patch superfamily)
MLKEFNGILPELGSNVYVAETAAVIGDVKIGDGSNIWYGAVIRGDVNFIRIGKNTNIQDGCVLHVSEGTLSLKIGNEVTVGHNATVHGCTIEDNVLIGMGAVLLDNCLISGNSVVAAGAVVKEDFVVPEGVLVAGVPAKIIRNLTDNEILLLRESSRHYVELAKIYSGRNSPLKDRINVD